MQNMLELYKPLIIVEIAEVNYEKIKSFLFRYGYGNPEWLGKIKMFSPRERNFVFKVSND